MPCTDWGRSADDEAQSRRELNRTVALLCEAVEAMKAASVELSPTLREWAAAHELEDERRRQVARERRGYERARLQRLIQQAEQELKDLDGRNK